MKALKQGFETYHYGVNEYHIPLNELFNLIEFFDNSEPIIINRDQYTQIEDQLLNKAPRFIKVQDKLIACSNIKKISQKEVDFSGLKKYICK